MTVLGIRADGTIVMPNAPIAPWWERLAWGAYGDLGWGDRLIYSGSYYRRA